MFKSNFKEKDAMEINLPEKSFDDILELLQIIYPPNKQITALNCEKVLELADEYQISELNKRCRQFLMQQRGKTTFHQIRLYFKIKTHKIRIIKIIKGTLEILLIAQRYGFDDVIKRCSGKLFYII